MSNRYCCGFLFWRDRVLLVRKTHPQWQDGLWNGVGGKIEDGETPLTAMVREFAEEAHIEVPPAAWRLFCVESGAPDYEVHFFRARVTDDPAGASGRGPPTPAGSSSAWTNDAGEVMSWHSTTHLMAANYTLSCRVVGNLRWLLPMAMDWRSDLVALVTTAQEIRRRPTW